MHDDRFQLRIQRKRTKDFRLPGGAVWIGRASAWHNPFPWPQMFRAWLLLGWTRPTKETPQELAARRTWIIEHLHELRGKQLACWCPVGTVKECHGDVLVQLANNQLPQPGL